MFRGVTEGQQKIQCLYVKLVSMILTNINLT